MDWFVSERQPASVIVSAWLESFDIDFVLELEENVFLSEISRLSSLAHI